MNDDIYMYWLSTLYKIGSRKQNLLLKYFDTAEEIYNATAQKLQSLDGLTERNIEIIMVNRDMDLITYGFNNLKKINIAFVHRNMKEYPSLLKEIKDPPVGLFIMGSLPADFMPTAAIIGSRACSDYGLSVAADFAGHLAEHGVVVVSGMAKGIDSMAHKGAIKVENSYTIAVLGCGTDICYPAENYQLREQIAEKGCVISEYPPGVPPRAPHFPARNRIISGLSQVLVVVESGIKSGTLITVDQASDQGRDVMAVPGNITSKYSEGTNGLIRQGAEPACSYKDVLLNLGIKTEEDIVFDKPAANKSAQVAPEEKLVYDILTFEAYTFDEIVQRAKASPGEVQYTLTILEIKGLAKKLPGMRYIKTGI